MKIKVSKAQSNWFVFKEDNPDMNRVKWVRKQLHTVMLWEFFLLYLSLVKVIPETENLISCEPLGFKDIYFLERTSLFVIRDPK